MDPYKEPAWKGVQSFVPDCSDQLIIEVIDPGPDIVGVISLDHSLSLSHHLFREL